VAVMKVLREKNHLLSCQSCGRKVCVFQSLHGKSATMGMRVKCAGCFVVKPGFLKRNPVEAARIMEWQGGSE